MLGRIVFAGVMAVWAVAGAMAAKVGHVPPGRDPGGVAIAIVGPGIDYRGDARLARLARDGEGEIAGFDLIDGTRDPFVAMDGDGSSQLYVEELLGVDLPSRLAVFRADLTDRSSMAKAVMFASKSPARIVLLPSGTIEASAPDFEFLAAASKQFPGLLFIVPAGDQAVSLDAPGRDTLPNVIIVSVPGQGPDTPLLPKTITVDVGRPNYGTVVDIATAGHAAWMVCGGDECRRSGGSYTQIAAARVAALAARVSAEDGALAGAALKSALVALAKADRPGATRYGVIEKTGADFRAK